MPLIVETKIQRRYYKYLCMLAKVCLQPQNMHRLCKYKHLMCFIKKMVFKKNHLSVGFGFRLKACERNEIFYTLGLL